MPLSYQMLVSLAAAQPQQQNIGEQNQTEVLLIYTGFLESLARSESLKDFQDIVSQNIACDCLRLSAFSGPNLKLNKTVCCLVQFNTNIVRTK